MDKGGFRRISRRWRIPIARRRRCDSEDEEEGEKEIRVRFKIRIRGKGLCKGEVIGFEGIGYWVYANGFEFW